MAPKITNHIILAIIVAACFCVPIVYAAPVTGAASLIGSNNVTLNMAGATDPAWFEWGQSATAYSWRSPNATPSGGVVAYYLHGSPLNGATKFYVRACDTTGCGAQVSFTTAAVTPAPTTTFGNIFYNLTESKFDITVIPFDIVQPYTWNAPEVMMSIVWALFFSAVFLGLWMSGRGTFIPGLIGLIVGGFLWSSSGNGALGIMIAPEFVNLGQGVVAASLAGVVAGLFKR